jgi:hypothetical protein
VPAQTSSSSPRHGGRSERLTGAPLIYAAMGPWRMAYRMCFGAADRLGHHIVVSGGLFLPRWSS